jgi:hypothetical protein
MFRREFKATDALGKLHTEPAVRVDLTSRQINFHSISF